MRQAGLDPTDPLLSRCLELTQELLGFPRHLSQHVGGFVLTRGPLVRGRAHRQRRHGGPHLHRMGQGRSRRARAAQGRCARPRHAHLHPQGLRLAEGALRPRALARHRAARRSRRLRHAVQGGFDRRVPGREPGADEHAAAAQARESSTTSSSRSRSCAPAPSRATWCTPICAAAAATRRSSSPRRIPTMDRPTS